MGIEYDLFKHVSRCLDHGKRGRLTKSGIPPRAIFPQSFSVVVGTSKRVLLWNLVHMTLKEMSWVLANVSLGRWAYRVVTASSHPHGRPRCNHRRCGRFLFSFFLYFFRRRCLRLMAENKENEIDLVFRIIDSAINMKVTRKRLTDVIRNSILFQANAHLHHHLGPGTQAQARILASGLVGFDPPGEQKKRSCEMLSYIHTYILFFYSRSSDSILRFHYGR